MLRQLLLIPLLLLLAACQSQPALRDFDPTRDFSAYRSWSWMEPAVQFRPADPRIQSGLTEQRIREAVSEQLDQHGLRPAQGTADLQVRAWLIVDTRTQQYSTGGGYWGGPWHPYWGPSIYADNRIVEYQVATLQIDLHDARDGKLVWRGSAEQALSDRQLSPAERASRIRQIVAKVLARYPTH
ncbi:DUF4136 domain-containing protein [Stutzerimonas kirkiae]|uniref:DUF4136 domain-containing protein n=1 Tax=Stutzerimonas kirkiae TaxID=2211392 RepID=A0A4Q9RDK9_9GAMM|nr:DUF4136 domain-containing protein [Stutzerimonas kirkiae]TBU99794.1 DUF4136 domain-containing protein [Stutzerimonas kirkiae]TBV05274.1 DUF4136 domain-containing protein [Stutzerimonas kirkiae]TBV11708.1 DUF4136 domain-containing protein [Stutzerimonas kirkiae]TBV15363.1 DUF4136 domain-containing protein [Stutzerimonas kirkiae]